MAAQELETVFIKDPDAPEIFKSVEADVRQKRLTQKQREDESCGQFGETRIIFTDRLDAIRKYTLIVSGEDSAMTIDHYYDGEGRLRYVRAVGGAINKTYLYHRIQFDESGARTQDDRNVISGPGYPFPQITEESGLLSRDPRKDYDKVCAKQ